MKVPSGEVLARRPVASLGSGRVTDWTKRRQQVCWVSIGPRYEFTAVAEAASSVEGNTASVARARRKRNRRGRRPDHVHTGTIGTWEARPIAPVWSPEGGQHRGRPEDWLHGRQGGGLGRSTGDDGEGHEPDGGKAPTTGEPGRGAAGPDTALEPPARQSRSGERRGHSVAPDPVHGAVPPPHARGARTGVPAAEADGSARRGWDDGGGLRARPGGQPPGAPRPPPGEPVPAEAGAATYIPKADGGQRALGILAIEDKIVQGAVAEVLNAIYEADFRDTSFGFRPGRSAHNALRAVHAAIMTERVGWVVDADIRNFFGRVDHAWLMRMIAHRIADPRILRLIRLWLRAGVMEDGVYADTVEGTPQGAGISPLLANIYLHYALDLWVAQWRRREARRHVRLVRDADDCAPRRREEVRDVTIDSKQPCCTRDEGRPLGLGLQDQ